MMNLRSFKKYLRHRTNGTDRATKNKEARNRQRQRLRAWYVEGGYPHWQAKELVELFEGPDE